MQDWVSKQYQHVVIKYNMLATVRDEIEEEDKENQKESKKSLSVARA